MIKLSEKARIKRKIRMYWKPRILKAQGFQCKLCGKQADWRGYQLSHIIPLSLGGKDEESNYEVLCAKCHAEKRHHLKEA